MQRIESLEKDITWRNFTGTVSLMSKSRNILLVVEGKSGEPDLMNTLFGFYYPDRKYQIWSYKTNIYDLYNKLANNDVGDFEDLDLLLTLRSCEQDQEKKKILEEKYTDLVLIFDYEPQDNRFSTTKINQLMSVFNDSTDRGKLYINYPMLESFKHFKSIPDPDYEEMTIDFEVLSKNYYINKHGSDINYKSYKHIVSLCSLETCYRSFTREMCNYAIAQNVIGYSCIDLNRLLDIQNNRFTEHRNIYVINTACTIIVDFRHEGQSAGELLQLVIKTEIT